MPELPEIEIVKRSLFKMINKAKIVNIKIINKNLRYKIDKNFSKDLVNKKILSISRRSKYLVFYIEKKILLAHFGMSGKLLIKRNQDNKIFRTSFYYDKDIKLKHNHIYFQLNNGLVLIYNDIRRFGFFKIYDTNELNQISFLKKLGVEPLSEELNLKYFKNFVENRKKNIKNLLMDQTFISGLGNIYVNEALYLSRIKPTRLCNKLTYDDVKNLILNIRKILKLAIKKGGSSLRDFKNIDNKSGSFQQFFNVYGQINKKCSRISCNGKIKKIAISNRSSFYCSKCQI
jgi:formamidopyrimidine-DNA glycosylase